jgi:hypothetical protein
MAKIRRRHRATSILQGDLNFAFDQRESEVNLHKTTSSHESHPNMSPDIDDRVFMSIFIHMSLSIIFITWNIVF